MEIFVSDGLTYVLFLIQLENVLFISNLINKNSFFAEVEKWIEELCFVDNSEWLINYLISFLRIYLSRFAGDHLRWAKRG